MAYFVWHWIKVHVRKSFLTVLSACQTFLFRFFSKGRMKNSVAYFVLGTLGVVVILSSLRCSNTSTSSTKSLSANEKSVKEFMSAVRKKETHLSSTNLMDKTAAECSSKDENSFSASNMSHLFQLCAQSKHAREVDMDSYLDAWEELIRFLNSMGKAFTFVSSDVIEKVGILRDFRNAPLGKHYTTIEKMIQYEKENNLINFKQAPSKKVKAYGSRTLLRLHRALKFLLILIGKLARNEDDGKVSVMGYNAYHASPMSEYHPWIVRKAVGLAVYMLPERTTFIKQMCQDVPEEELAKTMQICSESMDAVYEYTHTLYSKYDIMEIP